MLAKHKRKAYFCTDKARCHLRPKVHQGEKHRNQNSITYKSKHT